MSSGAWGLAVLLLTLTQSCSAPPRTEELPPLFLEGLDQEAGGHPLLPTWAPAWVFVFTSARFPPGRSKGEPHLYGSPEMPLPRGLSDTRLTLLPAHCHRLTGARPR